MSLSGWHCDCRTSADEDADGNEILLPCCWCGDNSDDTNPNDILCPNWDDPDRNECVEEANS